MANPVDHPRAKQTFANPVAERRVPSRKSTLPLRWWIVGLIFLITCINYVDRSSVGLLVTQFGPEIGITSREYGFIGALLLLAYTLSQSVSGRLYDRFGARAGFTVSIVVWCTAAMAHSAIVGFTSFAACSFFLGLGEAGNWPGAAKVIAEWFPQRERALGMAIFNGGASMGGVLAPLLVARFLAPRVGWRISFLIIGALGFLWLIAWLAVYRPLDQHPRVSEEERRYIQEGHASVASSSPPSLRILLSLRATWSILVARFLVDPIWWLYILWLPDVSERGSSLQSQGHRNLRLGSLSCRGHRQPLRRMACRSNDRSRRQRECRSQVDDWNCRVSYDGRRSGSTR